ncbi:DUF262 domain-containing protein [Leptospira bandrabouensis]|uniref:DUF262 domain-containing protein n=1 Tax=Leptospira bandrabouensis TaxID=2484903 RepID=UPI001EE89C61|nr:DUF1524 domain-containing protein [Leptospira bandrabouensis]MCG6146596.1 DUF262 domain-containing HNH endonuclease family protein [Leptospira bandrabouensis]MCG6161971.1 DUF262 domain-containing HNH endonuclease family protein [Leptospira bandrabouensis]MCG6166173.1 DUF262 domain-containing HNH endonuclease family protein [Leptospira bandrabouensis]
MCKANTISVHSWEEKQVIEYLEDINNAITTTKKDYFLGPIVVIDPKNDTNEIVDGQQRLATTTIILSAIRDLLKESANEDNLERCKIIEDTYLFKKDIQTLELKPNLKLNLEDDVFFKEFILSPNKSSNSFRSSKPSHSRLQQTYEKSKYFLKKNVLTSAKNYKELLKWQSFLDNSIKVIWIQVEDYSYAYTIFETLNDRGLDLTVTDLLKNLIFSQSGNQIQLAQENWTSMITNLESFGKDNIKVDFIRHFWASKHGLTREKDLYTKIKNNIKTSTDAIELADQLTLSSDLYISLLNAEHPSWHSFPLTTKNNIIILNMLGMSQNRPLLLAILLHFEVKQINISLNNLVNWAVRFIITGSLGSSILEQNFASNAKLVSDKKIKNSDQLFEAMKDAIPTDKEFEDKFKIALVKRSDLAIYILTRLENAKKGDKNPEEIPNTIDGTVNLEHILPKTITPDWEPKWSAEKAKSYINRIGNLCLLKTKQNSKIGNSDFQSKLKDYTKSKFELTKSLTTYQDWNPENIEMRQLELAKLAIKIWPRRVDH